MAFRTIVINNRCKLSYSLNYMIVRKNQDVKKIMIDEIKLVVVNTLEVSITSALISELSKRKVKVIFCNEKYNPECEITPYYNNYYSYRKLKEQLSFSDANKDYLWQKIIETKIINQRRNLEFIGLTSEVDLLNSYIDMVELGDITNREGHAAKVYFNACFGKNFGRRLDIDTNKYLNYGYAIILSTINRIIKMHGYLTELGIHHIGESNSFNLSCDFMEPLRPLVDSLVINKKVDDDNFKTEMIKLLERKVIYNSREYYLDNAIEAYVDDLLIYLKTGLIDKINFIEYEL